MLSPLFASVFFAPLSGLLLASQMPVIYYMFPITAVIALVYSASRYEDTLVIFQKSVRLFAQITIFLVGILLLLYILSVRL